MRVLPLLVVALFTAAPAVGQSLAALARKVVAPGQVLTNANLKPVPALAVPPPALRPAATYEHFLARQAIRDRVGYGPQIIVIGSPTAGPFGEFKPFDPPRRLDGTLLSDPPWRMTVHRDRPRSLTHASRRAP